MITPEQKKNIQSWATQRDEITREISILQGEKERLLKSNIEAAESLNDKNLQIAEIRGRIESLNDLEIRMRNSLAEDIQKLELRKSELQTDIDVKRHERDEAINKKLAVESDIRELVVLHDKIFDRKKIMDEVFGKMLDLSQTNISDLKILMADVHKIVNDVIEKANKNVAQTDIVLGELPKYIFEMQKPLPIRRIPVDEQKPKKQK